MTFSLSESMNNFSKRTQTFLTPFQKMDNFSFLLLMLDQVIMAQWLARQLTTGEVPGSDPGKDDNLLISD